jgi:hypothetical protein
MDFLFLSKVQDFFIHIIDRFMCIRDSNSMQSLDYVQSYGQWFLIVWSRLDGPQWKDILILKNVKFKSKNFKLLNCSWMLKK